MTDIQAVFIDVDDTLLDFEKSSEVSIQLSAEQLGISLPDNFMEIFEPINQGFWRQLEQGLITREQLFERRFPAIFSSIGIEADGLAFEKLFKSNLWHAHIPVEHSLETLSYLSSRYPVYAASNGPFRQQENRLKESDMLPYMKDIFVSEDIGAEKPQKAFFEECFRRVPGLKPEDTVMIGDSLTSDIAGACAYGMKTIWFNAKHKPECPDSVDVMISSLDELTNLL